MDNLWAIGITAVLGIISSIATYYLGRRAKLDDLLFSKGFPIAEKWYRYS